MAVIDRANVLGLSFNISIPAKSIYNYTDRNKLNITHFHLRFKLRRGKTQKQYVKYSTTDNGSEFYKTVELQNENLQVHFTCPYCSYKKGWVRSFNGII